MAHIDPFYDREYDTSISVPDEGAVLQGFIDRSASARQQLGGQLDLAYGSGDKETLDLFGKQHSARMLVFIHGGFWRASDKADWSCLATPFVEAGYSVAMLNYGLCPTVTLDTIVEQCRRAISWLYQHARDYGSDHMTIVGHSAGGHLAAMMFATDWAAYNMPNEAITDGVALSGLFDLAPLLHTRINADLRLDEDSAYASSPIHHAPRINAALFVVVGKRESSEFQRQSSIICAAWPNCVGPVQITGCHHFSILNALLPALLDHARGK